MKNEKTDRKRVAIQKFEIFCERNRLLLKVIFFLCLFSTLTGCDFGISPFFWLTLGILVFFILWG
jgi:hypothetical protein